MFSHASLKLKLTVGFGVLVLILLTNSLVGYFYITRLTASSDVLQAALEKRKLVLRMALAMEQQRAGVRRYLLGSDDLEEVQSGRAALQQSTDDLASRLHTEEGKRIFGELVRANQEYAQTLDRMLELRKAGKTKEAIALCISPEATQRLHTVNAAFDAMERREEHNKAEVLDQERAEQDQARRALIFLALAGVAIAVGVTVWVPRTFAGAISGMIGVIEEISRKNLTVADLPVNSEDEIGAAGAGLNSMKNNLRELIHSIARTAEHVASASEEISASATEQSQSAETQKGQTTQVAVAMQEMSSTVHEVSDNSNRAAEASRHAAETARGGGTIVEDALAKMQSIAASVSATAEKVEELGKGSDQIGRIIGVIDDIADQTNLLALNAAIEAARAGEQGRGFAVVADEVRKLAERTTSATKEVAQMVQNIQGGTKTAVAAMHEGTEQVQQGVQTTAKAGEALKQIIRMAEEVGEMITHIATAAAEQSSATEQVNQNVEQITRLVNESAAGAKQSAQACQDLSWLALDLQKLVSSFQLDRVRGFGGSSAERAGKPDDHAGTVLAASASAS